MAAEKIQNNQHEQGPQEHEALEKQSHERQEQLRETLNERLEESRAEKALERSPEEAQKDAEKLAKSAEKEDVSKEQVAEKQEHEKELQRTPKTLDASFNNAIGAARASMSRPSKAFSKLIHIKAIEKTSEAVGSTIARPNAVLSGSLVALIFTAVIYIWAKTAGYPLSGFETIAAFIIGWLVGIIFDFVRIMITGKR